MDSPAQTLANVSGAPLDNDDHKARELAWENTFAKLQVFGDAAPLVRSIFDAGWNLGLLWGRQE